MTLLNTAVWWVEFALRHDTEEITEYMQSRSVHQSPVVVGPKTIRCMVVPGHCSCTCGYHSELHFVQIDKIDCWRRWLFSDKETKEKLIITFIPINFIHRSRSRILKKVIMCMR